MPKIESGRRLELLQQLRDHGESYGLAIVDRTNIPRGSVYVILARLEDEGLMSSRPAAEGENPRLRVYDLTESGRLALGVTEAAMQAAEAFAAEAVA